MSHRTAGDGTQYGGAVRRNSYALAALAAAAVPGLNPARTVPVATPIDEFDVAGVIGEDGRRVLITAPSTTEAGVQLEKELGVVDALTSTSIAPLVAPPVGYARLAEGGRAVVTEPPSGAPLMFDELTEDVGLARSLGRVIARIHAVPAYVAEAAGAEMYTAQAVRAGHRSQVHRAREAGELPAAVSQRWDALLGDDDLWAFRPCFVHANLSEECLFTDGEQISGVTGWHEARSGDPAVDLAWLVSALEPAMFDALYAAYVSELPVAPHARLVERAQAVGELAVVDWLLHGIDADDETIVEDARGMLDDLDHDLTQLAREEAERAYDDLGGLAAGPGRAPGHTDASAARHEPAGATAVPPAVGATTAPPSAGATTAHEAGVAPTPDGAAADRDRRPSYGLPADHSGSHAVGLGEAATLDAERDR